MRNPLVIIGPVLALAWLSVAAGWGGPSPRPKSDMAIVAELDAAREAGEQARASEKRFEGARWTQTPAKPAASPAPEPVTQPLPEAIAQRIDKLDQNMTKLRDQVQQAQQTYELVRENLLLKAALELGLTKKEFEASEVTRDAAGHLVFKRVTPPASPPPATPAPVKGKN